MRSTSLAMGLAVVLSTTGCAIVSTVPLGASGATGIPYMLPKALLPLEVVASGNQVRIDVLEPVVTGDPDQAFVLYYNASAFSKDDVKLEVDPKTSLLKTVTLVSTDETGEVLKKAISTFARAESATGSDETVLLQTLLDPDDPNGTGALSAQIDATIAAHLTQQRAVCASAPDGTGCAALARLGVPGASISLSLAASEKAKTAIAAVVPGDCSVGICHRANLPYRIELQLFGQSRSTLVLLPNKGPVLALPLERQAFVQVKHTVVLRNGIVEKYDTEKPSSALAIVSWPLDVYGAIVDTTAKILQFKIDTSRNSLALQEQLATEAEKRKALEDRLAKLVKDNAKPEGAGLVDLGASNKLLTVGNGVPPRTKLPPGADKGTAPVKDTEGPAKTLPSSDGKTGSTK